MQTVFENRKLKVLYIKECSDGTRNKTYIFNVDIKDFDTPRLNIEYDDNEKVIVRTWIDEDSDENVPKNHVVYKIFSLIEYEVFEIMRFMIQHI